MGGDEQERGPPHLHQHHALHRPVPQRHGAAQLRPEPGTKHTRSIYWPPSPAVIQPAEPPAEHERESLMRKYSKYRHI